MRITSRIIVSLVLLAALSTVVEAQGMPTAQPGRLTIIIEELKIGMGADHEVNEAGWPAAFAKANSPYYYLALEAMTGAPEIWFVSPYESWAAEGAAMKMNQENAALAAELSRLGRTDGQYLASVRTIQAIARPDLSHGQFPDLALVRFYEVTTFRIRPGHEQAFENASKLYIENVKRHAPNMSYRVYQVTAGMPSGTYLIFGSANSYAEFDQQLTDGNALWAKVTPKDVTSLTQANSKHLYLRHHSPFPRQSDDVVRFRGNEGEGPRILEVSHTMDRLAYGRVVMARSIAPKDQATITLAVNWFEEMKAKLVAAQATGR